MSENRNIADLEAMGLSNADAHIAWDLGWEISDQVMTMIREKIILAPTKVTKVGTTFVIMGVLDSWIESRGPDIAELLLKSIILEKFSTPSTTEKPQ